MKSTSYFPLQPIQSTVIEILADKPNKTVQEIHKLIVGKFELDISLANFYRSIAQMLDAQILVKNKGKLSLNSVWIPHILRIAKKMEDNYLNNEFGKLDLTPGERREYYADSLASLDIIWNDLLGKMSEASQDKEMVIYNAHAWHALAMKNTEVQLFDGLAKKGFKIYLLYGDNTWLDQYAAKLIKITNYYTTTNPNHSFVKENYAANVAGEYILEVFIPEVLCSHFRMFFDHITSVEQYNPELFSDIFKMKVRCKLTVRRNKADADYFREEIKEFFK